MSNMNHELNDGLGAFWHTTTIIIIWAIIGKALFVSILTAKKRKLPVIKIIFFDFS